jgi:Zn-dependent protease
MDSFLAFPLEQIPFVFIALAIAFTFHEFAHAYSAYKFGDPTAQQLGRVTLDPRKHLDVFGTILILLAGFGWARPVPVNRSRFKHPRMMGIVVSFVGPLSNLLIALVGMLLVYVLAKLGAWQAMHASNEGVYEAVRIFFQILINLNLILFVFNLIPLPPLDGYRIVEDLAPLSLRYRMMKLEQWGIYIFLLLVFIPPLSAVTIQPLFSLVSPIFWSFDDVLKSIFGPVVAWSEILRK